MYRRIYDIGILKSLGFLFWCVLEGGGGGVVVVLVGSICKCKKFVLLREIDESKGKPGFCKGFLK